MITSKGSSFFWVKIKTYMHTCINMAKERIITCTLVEETLILWYHQQYSSIETFKMSMRPVHITMTKHKINVAVPSLQSFTPKHIPQSYFMLTDVSPYTPNNINLEGQHKPISSWPPHHQPAYHPPHYTPH